MGIGGDTTARGHVMALGIAGVGDGGAAQQGIIVPDRYRVGCRTGLAGSGTDRALADMTGDVAAVDQSTDTGHRRDLAVGCAQRALDEDRGGGVVQVRTVVDCCMCGMALTAVHRAGNTALAKQVRLVCADPRRGGGGVAAGVDTGAARGDGGG